jgi:RND family efflux transporter MFP subunit
MTTQSSFYRSKIMNRAALAILFAGLLGYAACARVGRTTPAPDPPESSTVAVAKVSHQPLSHVLEIAAEFRPNQEINVYSKVAGYVKKIWVDYGDRVQEGQVIAELEVPELVDELQRSEAATRQAVQEIAAAQSELERSESVHEVAALEYTRLAGVMKSRPGLIAQQDIDTAFGKERESEAKKGADQGTLAAAQQQLQVAQANEQKVRTLLAYTKISAPFQGVITQRYADNGAMIQQGTASSTQAMPLVRLAQTDVLRLVIPVPESDVPHIRLGDSVQVTVTSLNRVFKGKVARFSDQLDLQTRTMHTEVDVENPNLVLIPGMYATARLVLDQSPDALAVPVQAIRREGDQAVVFRVNRDNTIERCPVQLGIENSDHVEIKSGLKEDDLVVVGAHSDLKAGDKVRFRIESPKAEEGRS